QRLALRPDPPPPTGERVAVRAEGRSPEAKAGLNEGARPMASPSCPPSSAQGRPADIQGPPDLSMRTLVRGGWVVGFAGHTHTLIPDGVVVYENDRVLHVGRRFEGAVDAEIDARGRLVAPGFIDTHVHSGHRASHRLITDTGRPDFYGQPFLEITVPREGTRVGGDPRYARPTDTDADAGNRLLATFTVAEMLRNGITPF